MITSLASIAAGIAFSVLFIGRRQTERAVRERSTQASNAAKIIAARLRA